MSARDWQPGDEVLVPATIMHVSPDTDVLVRVMSAPNPLYPEGKPQYVGSSSADLLPVPEPDDDAIERAAEVMWDATCSDGLRAAMRPDLMVMARALAAAGLLASPVQPGRSEAEIKHALTSMLTTQRDWSAETFGPGDRLAGVLDHIGKELDEIRESPRDAMEWIDVVILAFDGAWRAGHEPAQIAEALLAKYAKNRARTWPDWRTMPADKAIEHVRVADTTDTEGGES